MKLVALNTKNPHYTVQGEISQERGRLYWEMSCLGPSKPWTVASHFGEDFRKNWELWNTDVLEIFLQPRRHADEIEAPYLELQVSPLNQALALVILKPRVSFYTPLSLDFRSEVEVSDGLWRMNASLSLPSDFQGEELWGGMFSCLGASEREYHAPDPFGGLPANFHQPQYFQRFI